MQIEFYFEKAFTKVKNLIDNESSFDNKDKNSPVIISCESFEFGWLFYYNSRKVVETNGADGDYYLGNLPYFIDKFDGEVLYFGRKYKDDDTWEIISIESQIEEYFNRKYPNYWKEIAAKEAEFEEDMRRSLELMQRKT